MKKPRRRSKAGETAWIKRLFTHLLFTALLLAGPAQGKTLLILGDSLSAAYGVPSELAWAKLLEQRLSKTYPGWQVINASISGETTDGGLRRLPALLREHQPAIILIELGGNDGLRGFTPTLIRDHLQQMITLSRTAGSQAVLLGIRMPPNYGPRYSDAFHAIFTELAQHNRLPLVPFFLDGIYDQPGMMQDDRLHPTAAAQPLLLNNVWPVLDALLKTP